MLSITFFFKQRMTWIKTNFLWMMHRCAWATKKNQDRVLAIWIKRILFEKILRKSVKMKFELNELEKKEEKKKRQSPWSGIK